jgi:hypothetical protein
VGQEIVDGRKLRASGQGRGGQILSRISGRFHPDGATADRFLSAAQLEAVPAVRRGNADEKLESIPGSDRAAQLESAHRGKAPPAAQIAQGALGHGEVGDAGEDRMAGEVTREEGARRRDLDANPPASLRQAGVVQAEGLGSAGHPARLVAGIWSVTPRRLGILCMEGPSR